MMIMIPDFFPSGHRSKQSRNYDENEEEEEEDGGEVWCGRCDAANGCFKICLKGAECDCPPLAAQDFAKFQNGILSNINIFIARN